MKSKNKEIVIVLPNRDEWPAGKTKDDAKLLSLISAEYGLGDDVAFFHLHKQKNNKYQLRLVFIPASVGDLHSVNAKKFVMFELMRNEINSVLHIDDDLNKRAAAILDLVNNDDPNAKETIRAKLSAILDVGDELEHIVDLLLTDAQFNSFKYTVLNSNKTTCLLCVNTGGIYVRSIEAPFDVQDSVLWIDIKDISCKNKKLSIHRDYGHVTELTFLNKKAASVVHQHLREYLAFMGTKLVPEASSWFGRISQRIRKSFGRKSTSRQSGSQVNSPTSEKPTSSVLVQHKSTAPSTIPESSFISEDVMDNPISMVEPSLKTNSTYDVSLGSDNSYRPTLTSLSNEELSNNADRLYSFQKPLSQYSDDHASMKTTSTYEVSLDSRQLGKPTANDNDSYSATGQSGQLYSFGTTSSNRTSPPQPIVAVVERVDKQKIASRPPIIEPEQSSDVIEESKSMRELAEPSMRSVTVSATTVTTTHTSSTYSKRWEGPVVDETKVTPEARDSAQSPLATTPVAPITAQIIKTPPELPVRTVTEYIPQKVVTPEPPTRVTSYSTDHSQQQHQQQQYHLNEQVAIESAEMITKTVPEPIRKGGAMVPDTNRKLSMTIEPIKEEEIVTQSVEHEECINDAMANVMSEQRRDSGGDDAILHDDTIDNVPSDDAMMHQFHMQSIDVSHNDVPTSDIITTTPPMTPADDLSHDGTQALPTLITDKCAHDATSEDMATTTTPLSPEGAPDVAKNHQRPDILDIGESTMADGSNLMKSDSKLPMSRARSIPSPKVQRPSRIPAKSISSPKDETSSPFVMTTRTAQSPSDKENYENDKVDDSHDGQRNHHQHHHAIGSPEKPPSSNFSRFESQEYKVDSKTTFTSVSTVGDNIVKKSTQTEISSIKSTTGIPTPKQYKSTTTITSTIKKPADLSKSPSNSATKIPTGIPRMSSK